MRLTINYQYAVTQKFVGKLLSKPISCIKLREQYKSITAPVMLYLRLIDRIELIMASMLLLLLSSKYNSAFMNLDTPRSTSVIWSLANFLYNIWVEGAPLSIAARRAVSCNFVISKNK